MGSRASRLPYIFIDEEIKKYFSEDPIAGEGLSFSKALSHRGVVTEAVSLARTPHAQHLPSADVGEFVGRLAGSRLRDGSSTSSARSRSRRRPAGPPAGPGLVSGPDPFQQIAEVLGRLGNSDKKPHHLDASQDKIHFDVIAVRARPGGGDHSDIEPLPFPDHESISKFKHTLDACRGWTGLPFLHHARVESFQPRWLGGRLSASQKEAFVKLRLKKESNSVAQLCNASLAFWLAHMAVGLVSFQQVACHIFLLPRVSEDYNSDYAILYHGRLMAGIRQRISMGEEFDIGSAISRLDTDVLREVDHKRGSSGWAPPPRERMERGSGKGKDKGERASGGPPSASDPSARPGGPARIKSVCFSRNPSKVCKLDKCHREHFNTNLPENKARFFKAQATLEENKMQLRKAFASV